jgi:hypothetical protein
MGRRDFEIDETISPPATALGASYIPYSRTITKYITLTYTDRQSGEQRQTDVVSSREGVTISILAAANPTLCKSYLENGIPPALGIEAWTVTKTQITYTLGPDGPRAQQEIVDEYVSEFMFVGGMGIEEYVINDVPVELSNNLVHVSRVVTEYQVNEAMGSTKTLATRYIAWSQTHEGSQLARALASQAESVSDIIALIADMSVFICDGTRIQNTQGRDFGVQLRPSEQDEARDRLIRATGYPITAFESPKATSLFNLGVKPDGFDPPEGFIPFGPGNGGASGSFYFDWDLPTVDPPENPQPGETWIDAETDTSYIWDGDVWTPFTPDPPEDPAVGDTWINSGTGQSTMWDGNDWQPYTPTPGGYPVEAAGAVYRNAHTGILYIWSGTAWLPYLDANPTSPDPGDRYVVAATGVERIWNGTSWSNTGTTWPTYSLSPPGSPTVGTVWIDRSDHTPKRWSGTTWVPFTPVRPPDAAPGDTWTDAATGIPYVWTGAEWIAYTTTPPPSPTTGQVYINPTSGIEYAWTGTAWVETGEVFGSTILSNVQPTAADSIRSTELDLPFPNDDSVAVDVGPAGVIRRWLVPGGVREQAQSLAELENALRYGTAYGSNVVVEAWQLPTEPLKPFYVRAGGIETQFLADGASWQWDADQLVVSCDGILCGATGRVPTERVVPWVPAMVDLAGLPAVGAPTVSSGPVPANTIATPAGFNAARPRGIWALLPTNGTDAFEEYRDPAYLFRPFSPVVEDRATMLITISEVETPYSLLPIDQGQEELVVATVITEVSYVAVLVKLPLTTITVTALAPAVESTGSVILPLTTITVTALAPVVESPGSVILPLTTITATALAPGVGVAGAPNFSSVSLLLPMNGTNGSTIFTDVSNNAFTVTPNGNAQISTAQSKWGGSSGQFDGNDDFLSIAYASALDLLGSDFTVEGWLRISAMPTSSGMRIAAAGGGDVAFNNTNGIHWLIQAINNNTIQTQIRTSSVFGMNTSNTWTLNDWFHFALCVSGSTAYLGLSGTITSGNIPGGIVRPSVNPVTTVGTINGENGVSFTALNANMDDFRIIKGFALYTESTYTVPPGPFPTG